MEIIADYVLMDANNVVIKYNVMFVSMGSIKPILISVCLVNSLVWPAQLQLQIAFLVSNRILM